MTASERQQRAGQRRADDARQLEDDRQWWQRFQGWRRQGFAGATPVILAKRRQADVVETGRIFALDPKVITLWGWVLTTCRRERIQISFNQLPQMRNGSAYAGGVREIYTSPVQSLETAAVAGHEIGHVVDPPNLNAPYTFSAPDVLVSVDGELRAWRWAMRHAPVWERAMHDQMVTSLASYRSYATADEAREIDALSGSLSFARERQRRVVGGPRSA